MDILQARTAPAGSGGRGINWTGWSILAAAGVLALGGCSAPPPPPFAIFDTEAGEQDTLPEWVAMEGGIGEARFLADDGTARYYLSRNNTDHCLIVLIDGQEDWFSGCSSGLGFGWVLTSANPYSGTAALVVDGYTERNPGAAEGWEQLHENVLTRGGGLAQELKSRRQDG